MVPHDGSVCVPLVASDPTLSPAGTYTLGVPTVGGTKFRPNQISSFAGAQFRPEGTRKPGRGPDANKQATQPRFNNRGQHALVKGGQAFEKVVLADFIFSTSRRNDWLRGVLPFQPHLFDPRDQGRRLDP